MALEPGIYTIQELLDEAKVDVTEAASVDYNERGWDSNRLRIGGLRFDELDDVVEIPEGATEVEITVDSGVVATLEVNAKEVPEAEANFNLVKKES